MKKIFFIIVVVSFFISPVIYATDVDLAGSWTGSYSDQNNGYILCVEIEQSGNKITGTAGTWDGEYYCEGRIKGTAKGYSVNFKIIIEDTSDGCCPTKLKCKGKLNKQKDRISFTFKGHDCTGELKGDGYIRRGEC